MTFQPGHHLSNGRPQGSANRRSEQLRIRLKDRGDVDPADYCSSIVSNEKEPTELRLAASNYLLPYLYPKRGAVPTPRYVEESIDIPQFTHLSDAEQFIAKVTVKATVGPKGNVVEAQVVKSTAKNKKVDACVIEAFKKIKFPPPKDSAASMVTFPIEFNGAAEIKK